MSSELASVIFDAVDAPIWVVDAEGRICHLNRAFEGEFGCESGDITGRHLWDVVARGEEITVVREAFDRIAAGDESALLEFPLSVESESRRSVDWETTIIRDEQSRVVNVIGIGSISTGDEGTSAGLFASETHFRVLVESMTDGLVVDDRDGRMSYVNARFCGMLDYSKEELLGQRLERFLDPANRSILAEQNAKRGRGEIQPYEISMIRRNGEVLDVLISPQQFLDDAGRMIGSFGVITDLTAYKQMERERNLLVTAIEQSAETVVITDADGTIQYVNPAFEDITGYSRAEAVGQNPRILKSGKHDEAFYRDLWDTISSGEVWSGVVTNRAKDGSLYEEEASISPVRGIDGQIIAYVGVKRDISEELRLSQKLAHAQKLEALGHLAGGIAHNINNLLMTISGSTELLRSRVPPDLRGIEEFLTIEKTVARAADVSRRLLSVARQQVLATEVIDFRELLRAEIELLRTILPETVTIASDVSSTLPAIRGDRDQVRQLLVSLVFFARDAMPEGGTITISASGTTPDAFLLAAHPDAIEGRYVRLSIADTGVGVDAETRDRIFDPFYGASPGTDVSGLDLAAVYGITRQHGGMIDVESNPGIGSRFDVYLPATAETPQSSDRRTEGKAVGGAETILVVEDEDGVRHTQVEMLTALGYAVIEAENGRVALEIIERENQAIDLVLSDVAMPEMGGRELLNRVRKIRPEIPFVFSSGFSGREFITELNDSSDLYFISKPYSTARLATIVREALDSDDEPE